MRDFEVITENLRHALAAFSFVRNTGEVVQGDGVSLVYAGVPFSLFNTALLIANSDFDDVLDYAERYFRDRAAPWSIWLCDDYMTAVERRRSRISLATRGLKLMMDAPGMMAAQLSPPRSLPGVIFRPVGDAKTRSDFSHVMSVAFSVPEEMAREVYVSETLWAGTIRGWIAYVGGVAASTTATVMGGGAIGVYAVATVPDQQRKGLGEALMRHAVHKAELETGVTRTVLQSSVVGYPLYVRMGYRNITRFCVYVKM